jgi:acyl transferase domain-containing protein
MIVVRNCFVARPGQASRLATQLKDAADAAQIQKHRILTDLTGEFNRVVFEYEAENISEVEAQMQDYATNETFREKMKGYTDLWVNGYREILRIFE